MPSANLADISSNVEVLSGTEALHVAAGDASAVVAPYNAALGTGRGVRVAAVPVDYAVYALRQAQRERLRSVKPFARETLSRGAARW